MKQSVHQSVLLQESIEFLALRPGMTVVDATFGGGGHASLIAEVIGADGILVAIDRDESVFRTPATHSLGAHTNFIPIVGNFRDIIRLCAAQGVNEVDAVLCDLGLSSDQLEHSGRGFSFMRDEPLIMTMEETPKKGAITAEQIINEWSPETIATILRGFGEERYARSIARHIEQARKVGPIRTTGQLVEVIHRAVPSAYRRGRIHFATRTFQALRMAVNEELPSIEAGIAGAMTLLRVGGRLAVITFHSVEDRTVKRMVTKLSKDGIIRALTKKPIVPSINEIRKNPRSRSAKLRVVEKVTKQES